MRRMARRRRRVSPDDDDDATDDGAPSQPRSLLPWRGGTTLVGGAPGAADDDEAAPRRRWFGGTSKFEGGAPGAADDQTVNTETTGTRRQAAQQEEEEDDDDGIDWSKMPPEEVFKRFDTDGSGEIDLEEFKVMLKKLKIQMSSAKAVKYFKMCDVRSRRPAVLRRLQAIDATRVHQTRSWLVSFPILRPFGPNRDAPRRLMTAGRSTLKNFGSRSSPAIRTTGTRSASLPTRC